MQRRNFLKSAIGLLAAPLALLGVSSSPTPEQIAANDYCRKRFASGPDRTVTALVFDEKDILSSQWATPTRSISESCEMLTANMKPCSEQPVFYLSPDEMRQLFSIPKRAKDV